VVHSVAIAIGPTIGKELAVLYVLEGSVRKAGNRIRITAQLLDATMGSHLWADRFDATLEDIFELPDNVASSVAGVIEPTLQAAEYRRATQRPLRLRSPRPRLLRAGPQSSHYPHRSRPGSQPKLQGRAVSGWLRLWAGHYELAVGHFEMSLRLNPLRKAPATFGIAVGHFFARRLETAATMLMLSLQQYHGRRAFAF
jgi:hypothetical protein